MGTRDPRVDAYIERSAAFAQPILRYIREAVHAASPHIDETMKWSFPHFTHHGILCSMASFKEHCAFGFWNRDLIPGTDADVREPAMGQFGRIQDIADLPPRDTLIRHVREAMRLNEAGVKVTRRTAVKREHSDDVPSSFRDALEKNPRAAEQFRRFSPSQRQEYVEWVAEAKREETRDRRIATAIEWISEGKSRNWKYIRSKAAPRMDEDNA
ncbi:MAG TPA: YdeI/OmpD-associated family protein [Gemmatimonadaceae bacterium]|nr:YdeI/OmpD-associated family protein [Gemmatimonadaceae bacterium]